MTENFPHNASQNIPLLEAIRGGAATGPGQLAELAGIAGNNLTRKLAVLTEDGLIEKTGPETHNVALTATGEQALLANAVWRGEVSPQAGAADSVEIAFTLIDAWDGNPRTQFDPRKTEELAVSIGDKGILQAILVRRKGERFEVIIGERRRRAATLAVERGWLAADFAVPCKLCTYTDEEAEEVAGVENVQREDMHWMDLARYFRRLMDERGRSGPQLERLFGKKYSARKIQDYAKIARELAPEAQTKAYLPPTLGDEDDAKPNPDCLTYTKARELVGDKKERPALDLSPKLTVTLMEVIAHGLAQLGYQGLPAVGHVVVTRFAIAPVGGPLSTLSNDRKLTSFGFDRSDGRAEVVARTPLTEDVIRWLQQLGFHEDPCGALYKARAAVTTEFNAAAFARSGRYFTSELNGPERQDEAAVPEGFTPMAPARQLDSSSPSAQRDEGEVDRREDAEPEGVAAHRPSPAPPPPALTDLPPMLAIVALEVAHRISAVGVERGQGTWGAPVLASYYTDARGSQLVQGHKMLAFVPLGEKTLVCLGKAGREWLAATHGIEAPDGKPAMGDLRLQAAQAAFGFNPVGEGPYATFWLNPPPAEAAPPPEAEPDAPAQSVDVGSGASATTVDPAKIVRDQFASDIIAITAEQRALTSLASAARTAAALLTNLKGRSKAPKAEDVDPTIHLLTAAVDGVARFLPDAG